MEETSPRATILRFGAFEADLRTGQLRKHGVRIALPGQPFQILVALLEHAGHLVTREELRQKLWPDGTYVDFDRSLNSAVNRLRDALGDSVRSPRFIETEPRKGYRFIALVEIGAAGAASGATDASTAQPAAPQPRLRAQPFIPIILAAALLSSLSAVVVYVSSVPSGPKLYRALPLTSLAGNEQYPTFSPDGTRVAFVWDPGGDAGRSVYVKQVGSERLERLTAAGVEDDSPAWSPDGRSIAFIRRQPGGLMEIRMVPASGGPERKLGKAVILTQEDNFRPGDFSVLAWTPDSKCLIFPDRPAPQLAAGLSLLSIDTGEKWALTSPSQEWMGDFSPALSPDGRNLAFRRMASWSAGDLYVLALSATRRALGEPRRVTFVSGWISNPVWDADGRSLFFVSGQGDARRLFQVKLSGASGPRPLITLTGHDGYTLAISHAARRLAYARVGFDHDIWRFDNWTFHSGATPRKSSSAALFRPFLSSTWSDGTPQYSPDGTKIALQSERSGTDEIWVCDAHGSSCFQLTSMGANICGFPHWSPDGTQVVFHSRPKGQAEVFSVPSNGGAPRQLTNGGNNIAPSWSRDGRWIYYGSRRGGSQVWKVPAQGGAPVQVTRYGGVIAEESTDGRFLYYAKYADPVRKSRASLWMMPLPGGDEVLVSESLANASTFAPGGAGVYFITADAKGYTLQFRRSDQPRARKVVDIDKPLAVGMAVSPDEHWILYVTRDESAGDLMLLEDFPQ